MKSKDEIDKLTHKIIGCAMTVHSALGNGFQEVIEAVIKIMTVEQFYIDYINKRRSRFLHIEHGEDDRFPMIGKIENFEKILPLTNNLK